MLAKYCKATGTSKAAEKLVTGHLTPVAKIAMGNRGYGLPVNEMISEGNVGLMQAVKNLNLRKDLDWQPMQCGGLELLSKNTF